MGERDSRNGRVVLIWDLDESLILFHSLINGAFAKAHGPEVWLPALLLSSLQRNEQRQICHEHPHCDWEPKWL